MNFKDFYRHGQPRYSFEIFPAKDEKGVASLFDALKDLSAFDPAFVSVTYGAMGTTRDLTRDLALRVQKELGLTTAFHFTCVGANRASIREYVGRLQKEGLNLVVALRGDPPGGTDHFEKHEDGFSYANELVSFLREIDGFSIAVAGYPEGHIECQDKAADLQNLHRKVKAGADIVITQLFFDNRDYFDFVERARKVGIAIPIIPGIMPIVNFKQIEKITRMCGAKLPKGLSEELARYEADGEKIKEIGVQHTIKQCRELLQNGAPGIHFYTLNKSYSTRRVIEGL